MSRGRFAKAASFCCQREMIPATPTGKSAYRCSANQVNCALVHGSSHRYVLFHPRRRVFGDISLWHQKDGAAAKRPRRHLLPPGWRFHAGSAFTSGIIPLWVIDFCAFNDLVGRQYFQTQAFSPALYLLGYSCCRLAPFSCVCYYFSFVSRHLRIEIG